MKHLLLVRHAKSSWENASLDDFDRPLNDRGRRDAPEMTKRLLGKKVKIDAFISSPAKRAFSTCKYFAEVYGEKEKNIIRFSELYNPAVADFYKVVSRMDNDHDTIALFSHNPAITAFANELTEVHIDDMPTCGIFAIKADIKKWKDFEEGNKIFWFFDYPKLKE